MSKVQLAVTLVGLNYTPERSGIAPYTAGLARGLQDRGHSMRVVTAHPHYPEWRIAEGFGQWTRRDVTDGVAVHRVRHYVPSPPTGVRRAASEASFGARSVASRWGSPDVVLLVSPALISSAMAIARCAVSLRRPATGLIMQDLYSAGVGETGVSGPRVGRALAGVEAWSAGKVDGVAVIHERFRARVTNALEVDPGRVDVIRNWTHVRDVAPFDRAAERAKLGWTGRKVVLHAGAMGEKQGLANVVEAARHAAERWPEVLFVLMGDGGQRTRLRVLAGDLRTVQFVDPLPGDAYGRAMRSADVLLVNEKPGVVEMAVPSKLTSYFSTGVPVLAATDALSTTADEVAASGAGVRVDPGDPGALVAAARELCANHTVSAEIGARGPEYCARVLSEEAAIDGYEKWVFELVERAERRRSRR